MPEQVTRDVLTRQLVDPRIVRAFEDLLAGVPALFLEGRLSIQEVSDTQLNLVYVGSDGVSRVSPLIFS